MALPGLSWSSGSTLGADLRFDPRGAVTSTIAVTAVAAVAAAVDAGTSVIVTFALTELVATDEAVAVVVLGLDAGIGAPV